MIFSNFKKNPDFGARSRALKSKLFFKYVLRMMAEILGLSEN